MASITLQNLSRAAALRLLSNVQANAAPSHAIQGKNTCRFVHTPTVCATVNPGEDEQGGPDFSNNTFTIQSNYWNQQSLEGFIQTA